MVGHGTVGDLSQSLAGSCCHKPEMGPALCLGHADLLCLSQPAPATSLRGSMHAVLVSDPAGPTACYLSS